MLAARDAHMLTEDRMERMLAAPSVDEAAKIPEECGYGDLSGKNAEQVNAALEAHLVEIFDELARIVPEPELVDIFRRKYDYHNLKVLIKAQHTGTSGADLLSARSAVPAEVVREALVSGELQALPPEIAHAAEEAQSILARTSNPQLADFALDRAYFAALTKLAAAVTDPYAAQYVRLLIDNANLRAVVRTVRMGKDSDFLRLALVPGGETEALSRMYVTKPWGYLDQPDFVNACGLVETDLSPEALLGVCLGLEAGMGRVRTIKNGPRIIDIDLLLYEEEARDTRELVLPHPRMWERTFVLEPLAEITEGTPLGQKVKKALSSLRDRS